ncbi:hypothetical protein K9M42_00660 [Patescibacteria group bacterium]|nr:hypothetical protein [Patescibacteria group bacterium]
MGKLNGTKVSTHNPSKNEVPHADVMVPIPGMDGTLNGAIQTRIDENGQVIDSRAHIKGGQKKDL